MDSGFGTFGKIARDLARNPLGIIALFIVLIYGFAALLMGKTASVLSPGQGYILVLFLSLFPVVVLGVFAWLVSRHHAKLYAPTDFKTDEAFLQTLSPAESQERLEKEIEAEQMETSFPVRTEEETIEKSAEEKPDSIKDLIGKARMAEDLVFQKLQKEIKVPIQREVKILGTGELGIFDGVIIEKDQMTLIEVKFTRSRFLLGHRVRDVLYRGALAMHKAKERGGPSVVRLLLIIVTEMSGRDKDLLVQRIQKTVEGSLVPVETRFYDINELKNDGDKE